MQFANIEWRQENGQNNALSQPYSLDFNDVYFNSDNGLQETEHVFIAHNQLQQRFSNPNLSNFTIIEAGFGTGLNFLAVSALWLKLGPKNATLHYIGIERTPLSITDLTRAHALWPQFSTISAELIKSYSTLKYDANLFSMATDRIQLVLQANDIMLALPAISQKADAWMLDGFAPAKNADMWSIDALAHITKLSKLNTTFATFTSAGAVRRGLQIAGFTVEKHKGFGKKREMLSGIFR